jgi:O-antigen ligase
MILYYLMLLMNRFHSDPRFGMVLFDSGIVVVTPVKVVGLLAVMAAMFESHFSENRPKNSAPRLSNPLGVLFLGFLMIPILATCAFGTAMPADSISIAISFGLMLMVTRLLLGTEKRILKSIRVLILASSLASLWLYREHFIQHFARAEGVEQDANYEALTLITGIPLALWLARHELSAWWKRIAVGCVLVMAGGVLLTESRAGLIAAATIGLIAALGSRRKIVNLALVAIAALVILGFGPSRLSQRFQNIKLSGEARNGDEESTRIHIELLKAGVKMVAAHPIVGVGLEQFKSVAPEYNPELMRVARRKYIAHNTYLQIAAEDGLPATILFLALMGVALVNCQSVRRSSDIALADLGFAMQLAILGYGVAAASVTAEYVMPYWLIVFMSQNLREIVRARAAQQVPAEAAPAGPWRRQVKMETSLIVPRQRRVHAG